MAWSTKINEPEFQAVIQKNKRNKRIWAIVFIIAPIIVLPIVGVVMDEFTNWALGGVGLSVVLLVSYLISNLHTKYQRSWEGTVTDKYQKEEEREKDRDDKKHRPIYDTYNYVIIAEDGGKKHTIKERDNHWSLMYSYFNVGDRVRMHGGMDLHFPYEKFDKSADSILICPFCRHKAPATDDNCPKCHNPLLK